MVTPRRSSSIVLTRESKDHRDRPEPNPARIVRVISTLSPPPPPAREGFPHRLRPPSVPANVRFVLDDASEDDWLYPPDTFDFIHTRSMLGSFEDFREIIKKSFNYTKPGGWMESQV